MWLNILKKAAEYIVPPLAGAILKSLNPFKKGKEGKFMSAVSELEEKLESFVQDLEKVKGFSMDSIMRVIGSIISGGPRIGSEWDNAPEEVRKAAVVNVANRRIDLPAINEEFEASLLGVAYEAVKLGYDKVIE